MLESDRGFDEFLEVGPVSGFPQVEYELSAIAEAGDAIAGELPWSGEADPRVLNAFLVANNWRDAHAYPMRSIRRKILFLIGKHGIDAVSAARLKRMQAIRKKLRRLAWLKLANMQDLGGCRVIVSKSADVPKLSQLLIETSGHVLSNQNNYIEAPKKDGYRSHHLIFSYQGRAAAEVFTGRQIEVQIRTPLQHSWATAVEAVGMFRGEDLKSAKIGDLDWLRLFQLMSAEIAMAERCPESPLVPGHRERVQEIIELDNKLDAVTTLDNLSSVVRWQEMAVQSRSRPTYYIISYDNDTDQVVVTPYFKSRIAVASYESDERPDLASGVETRNVVLVEADKIDTLRHAYPNYFGDVQLFKQNLKALIGGRALKEYTVQPQGVVRAAASQIVASLAWLRRSRFNRPKGA
jgi:hypothetical protein